VVANQYKSDI
jgi:ubiquitin-conjugating enzyme (huntingtin interacting protein 2)